MLEVFPGLGSGPRTAIANPSRRALPDGTRKVPFSRELYIEQDDFREDPPRKNFRLSPGREVRLRYAYFVRCDADTTTQYDIDRGIVNIVVGFAPLKPAEFVVVSIQQKSAAAQG